MKRSYSLFIIIILLVILFTYTSVSKLLSINTFQHQLLNQPLPENVMKPMVWLLPFTELLTVGCLLIKPLRMSGLFIACGLMTIFTLYTGLLLLNVFDRVPCSCGGVLQNMTWHQHLIFNIFFLVISMLGVILISEPNYKAY